MCSPWRRRGWWRTGQGAMAILRCCWRPSSMRPAVPAPCIRPPIGSGWGRRRGADARIGTTAARPGSRRSMSWRCNAIGAAGCVSGPPRRCACRRRAAKAPGPKRSSGGSLSPMPACAPACCVWPRPFSTTPPIRSVRPSTATPVRPRPLTDSSTTPKWIFKPSFIPITRPPRGASARTPWCWWRRTPPASTTTPTRAATGWDRSTRVPTGRRG